MHDAQGGETLWRGGWFLITKTNERNGGTGREEMNDRISRNATERSECEWCGTWLGVVRWGLCMHNVVICQLWFQCQWRGGKGRRFRVFVVDSSYL